ncbi:MAG: hypothetical protein ACLFVJ_20090 [Persicimonas sp.]
MRTAFLRVCIGTVALSLMLAVGCSDDSSGGGAQTGDQDARSYDASGDATDSNEATTPDATTPDAATADASEAGGSSTRTGLEGFCDHYVDCGGTYYEDADACIDASIDHWGECRRAELDAFGDCMMQVDCDDWNPDTYNPANTECSEEWSAVSEASCD